MMHARTPHTLLSWCSHVEYKEKIQMKTPKAEEAEA